MKPSEEVELLEHLIRALASPIGIVLRTSSPKGLRVALYKVREASSDPRLTSLAFRPNPLAPESELWVLRTSPAVASARRIDE